jgi:hypothetical protein
MLDAKITVKDREILMSYGLLNELTKLVGDPNRAATLDLDPDLGMQVLVTVLAPRTTSGKTEEFDMPELTPDEAYQVFDWVKAHVLDFFMKRLQSSLGAIEGRKEDLEKLGSLLSGLAP